MSSAGPCFFPKKRVFICQGTRVFIPGFLLWKKFAARCVCMASALMATASADIELVLAGHQEGVDWVRNFSQHTAAERLTATLYSKGAASDAAMLPRSLPDSARARALPNMGRESLSLLTCATRYIGVDGSDAGNSGCEAGAPLRTLRACVALAAEGDACLFLPGRHATSTALQPNRPSPGGLILTLNLTLNRARARTGPKPNPNPSPDPKSK